MRNGVPIGSHKQGVVCSGVGFFTEILFSGCLIACALPIANAAI